MTAVFTQLIPDVPYPRGRDGIVWEITGTSHHDHRVAEIARDRRFGALVADALGATRVQLLQDSLLYKPAHEGGSVEWHQDHTYVGYLTPPRVVSLRIALLPEDEANGCMRVVDGSHRWGPVGDVRALREARVDSIVPSLTDAQRDAIAHATSLELAPGDVSLHHCLTLHGSAPNPSDRPRRTIILRMFDGACRLDRSALPPNAEPHFPTDADGHLAPDKFPIVFER
jgi:phytanoyl-CoA hydroxylase